MADKKKGKKKRGWLKRRPEKLEPENPPEEREEMGGEDSSLKTEASEPDASPVSTEAPVESEENAAGAEPELDEEKPPADMPPAEPSPEKKQGFFERLKRQLGKTKSGLVERVRQVVALHSKIDEEMFEEIEMVLIQADVGIETTTKIVDRMRRDAEARKANSPEALVEVFKRTLLEIVGHHERLLRVAPTQPTVMLVVGVNGVGKTTTIGKIAKEQTDQGRKVMLVAGDTFRAAAVEQLEIWASRTGSRIVKQAMGADPAAVCYDALLSADAREFDLILIDTAGRLHTKSNLMEELKKVNRVIKKVIPEAPHETLLVLDATTGQNALSQARVFSESVAVSGLIMTKLDGTAKGGILVALRDLFDIPVLKIGIGEGENDLCDFDPQSYIDALFES